MTDDERKDLRPGDVVRVRVGDGAEAECRVNVEPFARGGGWVVGLGYCRDRPDRKPGYYPIGDVVAVVSRVKD